MIEDPCLQLGLKSEWSANFFLKMAKSLFFDNLFIDINFKRHKINDISGFHQKGQSSKFISKKVALKIDEWKLKATKSIPQK